jgi:RNA polymerase sigma-70 factor (ECF subfamily)
MREQSAMKNERAVDRRVIEACQAGDREAFRVLFDCWQGRVYSVAYHYCGDATAARDISQQVFLKLFSTIGQFRFQSEFSTWLYRLTANVCFDEHRRKRKFLPWSDAGDMEVKEPYTAEEKLDRRAMQSTVRAAVLELKPKLRMVILLKYFEGMSYEEMAEALGCSPGTIASRLNRGHRALARKLGSLGLRADI